MPSGDKESIRSAANPDGYARSETDPSSTAPNWRREVGSTQTEAAPGAMITSCIRLRSLPPPRSTSPSGEATAAQEGRMNYDDTVLSDGPTRPRQRCTDVETTSLTWSLSTKDSTRRSTSPSSGADMAPDEETDDDDTPFDDGGPTHLLNEIAWKWKGFDDDGPTHPQRILRILHGRGNNWPITACTGLNSMPLACLASLSGGAGAALDDRTGYDEAEFDDDGPTRPPRILHGCGNNWPITACTGLDSMPPARLALLLGGAGAVLDDTTDYDDAGFDDDRTRLDAASVSGLALGRGWRTRRSTTMLDSTTMGICDDKTDVEITGRPPLACLFSTFFSLLASPFPSCPLPSCPLPPPPCPPPLPPLSGPSPRVLTAPPSPSYPTYTYTHVTRRHPLTHSEPFTLPSIHVCYGRMIDDPRCPNSAFLCSCAT